MARKGVGGDPWARLAAVSAALALAAVGAGPASLCVLPVLLLGQAGAQVAADAEDERVLIQRCRPARRPAVYGPIDYLPTSEIRFCSAISAVELFESNIELTDVSVQTLSETSEVLLVAQRRGPLHQVDVATEGDRAYWDLFRPAIRDFRGHSCLNLEYFCDITSVTTTLFGFLVIDRHRILEFNYTWRPEEDELLIASTGQFNNADSAITSLSFPTASTIYEPFNETFLTEDYAMTPEHIHAANRFVLVTDTGNHRVILFNATTGGQLEMVGQFGVTGQSRNDTTGLDWPYGVAVSAPAAEGFFEPNFANVFVADRRNHRLVKLSLGYPDRDGRLQLVYTGQYGGLGSDVPHNESLKEPVGVAIFRHYIFVAEAAGNAISVLKVHHERLYDFIFVTQLTPAPGIQLTGFLSVTSRGYVWFTYSALPATHGVGSFFLEEAIRESPPQEGISDIAVDCVNSTWYDTDLLENETLYYEHIGYLMNLSGINWVWPDLPGFLDIKTFNTSSGTFDLDLFNTTVFKGRLTTCLPPTTTPPPEMLSGGANGWNTDTARAATGLAARRRPAVACWASALALSARLMLPAWRIQPL